MGSSVPAQGARLYANSGGWKLQASGSQVVQPEPHGTPFHHNFFRGRVKTPRGPPALALGKPQAGGPWQGPLEVLKAHCKMPALTLKLVEGNFTFVTITHLIGFQLNGRGSRGLCLFSSFLMCISKWVQKDDKWVWSHLEQPCPLQRQAQLSQGGSCWFLTRGYTRGRIPEALGAPARARFSPGLHPNQLQTEPGSWESGTGQVVGVPPPPALPGPQWHRGSGLRKGLGNPGLASWAPCRHFKDCQGVTVEAGTDEEPYPTPSILPTSNLVLIQPF